MFKWLKDKLGIDEDVKSSEEESREDALWTEEENPEEIASVSVEEREAFLQEDKPDETEKISVEDDYEKNVPENDSDLPEIEENPIEEVQAPDRRETYPETETISFVEESHPEKVESPENPEISGTEEGIFPEKETEQDTTPEKTGFFQKVKQGLTKTRENMEHKLNLVLGSYVSIDDEMMEDLEDLLITSDMGFETTMEIIDTLKERIPEEKIKDPQQVKPLLKKVIQDLLLEDELNHELVIEPSPAVILVIGVNGVGKTTTIGKLSASLQQQGKSVIIAAADTFRAAAIDQIKTWGNRTGVEVIAHSEGADPSAVVYDGIQAAKARKSDVLICDTAGRLHNKVNLMKELEKISGIIDREFPGANRENLLVLDATTGQNALLQAKTFGEATKITGIALTKLDGTAKGGVVIPLQKELQLPVKLIGVGEGVEDLQPFDPQEFANALF